MVITSKTLFTDSRIEFTLEDSILEEGFVLRLQNMENPKERMDIELTFDECNNIVNKLFKTMLHIQ